MNIGVKKMINKIYFNDLKSILKDHILSIEKLNEYFEIDKQSDTVRVKIAEDVLIDRAEANFNADQAYFDYIYRYEDYYDKTIKEPYSLYLTKIKHNNATKPKVIIVGDSWGKLPPHLMPKSMGQHLKSSPSLTVKNIAHWGRTLQQIVRDNEHINFLKPDYDWMIISAGGNDLKNALKSDGYIYNYRKDLKHSEYFTNKGQELLKRVTNLYKQIILDVRARNPKIKICCHSYDYARPLVGGGRYIGINLKRHNIPDQYMNSIIHELQKQLKEAIIKGISGFENIYFVDLFGMTDAYPWHDDIHPSSSAFKIIADQIEKQILFDKYVTL